MSTRKFLVPYSTFLFPIRCEAALGSVSCGCAHAAPRSRTGKRKTSPERPPASGSSFLSEDYGDGFDGA